MKRTIFAALLCAFSMGAMAAEGDSDASPGFAKLDADKDGFINSEEANGWAPLPGVFSNVDVNQDGKLDQAEFTALEENLK